MEKEHWVVDMVKKLEHIQRVGCKNCKKELTYTVTTADTDMVPLYCGSVYDPGRSILVVAELTGDEYRFGCEGRLPQRVEQIFGGHFVYLNYKSSCPFCGGAFEKKAQVSWENYLTGGGKAFVVFYDEHYSQKVKEIL